MDLLDGLHASYFAQNNGKLRFARIVSMWKALEDARYKLASLYDSISFDQQREHWATMVVKTVDLITKALENLALLEKALENLVEAFERFDQALSTADVKEKEKAYAWLDAAIGELVEKFGSEAKAEHQIEPTQEGIIGRHEPHPLSAEIPFVPLCDGRDRV